MKTEEQQRRIGGATGTGKVIYEGSAKQDDLIFKEGWSVSTMRQSGQRSSTPSGNTQVESDAAPDATSGDPTSQTSCMEKEQVQDNNQPKTQTTYPRPAGEPPQHMAHLTAQEQQEDMEWATRRYSRRGTKTPSRTA